MTVMSPFAIVGQVPDTAGIVGPFPEVVTVVDPPPPSFEPDDEPDPDPLPPEEPEPELVPLVPEPPLLPLWFPPELPLPEPPEPMDLPPSPFVAPLEEVSPLEAPVPGPFPVGVVPFAHPTTVDAPSHARTVHWEFAIELTLHSFEAKSSGMLARTRGLSRQVVGMVERNSGGNWKLPHCSDLPGSRVTGFLLAFLSVRAVAAKFCSCDTSPTCGETRRRARRSAAFCTMPARASVARRGAGSRSRVHKL